MSNLTESQQRYMLISAVERLHRVQTIYDLTVAIDLLAGKSMVADHHAGYPRGGKFFTRLSRAVAAFRKELSPQSIVPCQIIAARTRKP